MIRPKITPCLWFDGQAEEAAAYYVSIFPDSSVTSVTPGPGGKALVVEFKLAGLSLLALNGGPMFKFNEAISLSIDCASQAEVDQFWEKLSAGGQAGNCGWLKDRYGVSWQVVPSVLPQLLSDGAKAGPVIEALMGMSKLDIQALETAALGK